MYIKVRVIAEAKEEKFEKISENHFKISVKAKRERGLANQAVIDVVRRELKVYNRDIRIVSGHHSPSKILSIDD